MYLLSKLLSIGRVLPFFIFYFMSAITANSQSINLSVDKMSLEKVFLLIEKQTDYNFIYSSEDVGNANTVTLSVRNAGIEKVLGLCFKNQPLTYVLDDKSIVVKSLAKNRSPDSVHIDVSARVVNENGEPVVVTVTEKGTGNATSSNTDGEFLLKNIAENAVILITGVSIEPFEVNAIGRRLPPVIVVRTKMITNDEVKLVATGYQTIPKERATGSFAIVNKEQFDNRASTDVLGRLEGLTSALVFNKQGITGATELSIRGRSTIFANDQPLIVVDNFPYDGDIANINPNDVESINILKDAAAASIWGVRAGNGVIVIVTKKGRFNQPVKVQFSTSVTVGNKPDLYNNRNFLDAPAFIDVEKSLFQDGFYDADAGSLEQVPLSPVVEILVRERDGTISSAEAESQISALAQQDIRPDQLKYLYRKSANAQNAVNVSGGSSWISYFLSAGYDKNQPTTIKSGYDRKTFSSNTTINVLSNLSLTTNAVYSVSDNNKNEGGVALTTGGPLAKAIYPYAQLADLSGNPLPIVKDVRFPFAANAESNGFLNWEYFPLKDVGLQTDDSRESETRISTTAQFEPIHGLNLEVKYQYETSRLDDNNLANANSYYARNLINEYATVDGSTGSVLKLDNVPLGGMLTKTNTELHTNNLRAQMTYARAWAKNRLDAIGGLEVRQVNRDANSDGLYGYDPALSTFKLVDQPTAIFTLYPSGLSGIIPDNRSISGGTDRFRSYFSNVAYELSDKYVFSASGRIDQSNFFGVKTNQRAVPLWSLGGKWNINKESFYHLSQLPHLAFRATYGYNGNLDRTVTAITTFSYYTDGAPLTGAKYADVSNVGNPLLRWERTGMLNLGLDFEFVKHLSGSVEYFQKRGVDLMGDEPLPPSQGVTDLRGNFAGMRGRGIDAQLNYKSGGKKFKWQSLLLFSYATDKVTRYDVSFTPDNYFAAGGANFQKFPIAGYPLYSIFSLKWGGLDPATGDPRGYAGNTLTKDYSLLAAPALSDLVYSGPARPVYSGGWTNSFSLENFTLSVNLSYKLGYYFVKNSINYDALINQWRGNQDFLLRWQKSGDETNTNVPSFIYPNDPNRDLFYSRSSVLVDRGDHVRIQYVTLSYLFSRDKIHRLPMANISVYATVNNPGIIWRANKDKIDPDFPAPAYGTDAVSIPVPRSASLGIRCNF